MIDLLVGADDRTGALEAAGGCADAGTGAVWVGSAAVAATGTVAVVDLGSRHVASDEAARRAAALEAVDHRAAAHKIDSLLRGNWAHELVARARAGRRRVLLVPALPAAGRTCAGGVVYDGDRPVADRSMDGSTDGDARSAVASSRPADHLRAAGASGVVELAGPESLAAWLAGGDGPPFAVCDAATEADLAAAAAAWAGRSDVLLAGTAATVAAAGAVVGSAAGDRTDGGAPGVSPPPGAPPVPLAPPVLVVCGSLHAMARRQVAHLGAQGVAVGEPGAFLGPVAAALDAGRAAVVATRGRVDRPVPPAEAEAQAAELAATARELMVGAGVGTLIVVGGDTAAAVLGPNALLVGGTLASGTPWARPLDGTGPLVVTRAGSYGTRSSLAELVWGRRER